GLLRELCPGRDPPLLGLDVGCNSGELSIAMYRHLLALPDLPSLSPRGDSGLDLHLLCCDIDPELIRRARSNCPFPNSMTFLPLDIMDRESRDPLLDSHLERFGRSRFDLALCMSVTMWIHLRHGDRGLREFLEFLSSRCSFLLLEPQPWKCYRAAARRLRRLGRSDWEHFRGLGIRGDVPAGICGILTRDCGMELLCSFGNTEWDRSLLLFRSTRESGDSGESRDGRE
ncbi:BN3D2 methyltransferase, partial [Campylorhamphus procurvoides]|nr:BN3D2 methyltransferase [Campylorhamphus procurvoides]